MLKRNTPVLEACQTGIVLNTSHQSPSPTRIMQERNEMLEIAKAMEYHTSEHERISTLQKLALNNKQMEFEAVLATFPKDKQADLREMCKGMREELYDRTSQTMLTE